MGDNQYSQDMIDGGASSSAESAYCVKLGG
jgi:hypothetical protein